MSFLDKLNPLKKKEEAFPDFSDTLGSTSSSVPGPSFDSTAPSSNIDFSPQPSPNQSHSMNEVTSLIQDLSRKLDSLSSSINDISRRLTELEKNNKSRQNNSNPPNPFSMNNNQSNYTTNNQSSYQNNNYSQPQQSYNNQQTNNNQNMNDDGWHF